MLVLAEKRIMCFILSKNYFLFLKNKYVKVLTIKSYKLIILKRGERVKLEKLKVKIY